MLYYRFVGRICVHMWISINLMEQKWWREKSFRFKLSWVGASKSIAISSIPYKRFVFLHFDDKTCFSFPLALSFICHNINTHTLHILRIYHEFYAFQRFIDRIDKEWIIKDVAKLLIIWNIFLDLMMDYHIYVYIKDL